MGLIQNISYTLLNRLIGSETIFKYYFGDFVIGNCYHSPLRKDVKKSVGFFINKKGDLVYNDFAEDKKYDFVEFVSLKFKLSYKEALTKIAKDFNIFDKQNIISFKPTPLKQKQKSIIRIVKRNFTKYDILYWNKYNISLEELISNNIYSVSKFYINNFEKTILKNELCYAYLLKDENDNYYFKIYLPNDTQNKWYFNAQLDLVYGLEDLPFKDSKLIITKSIKDYLVLKKYFTDVIVLQSESKSAMSKELIKGLKKCYKEIYVWFDCDKPGIKAANHYKHKSKFIPIFLGFNQNIFKNIKFCKENKCKDPSDFIKKFGVINFEKWITYVQKN